MSDIHISDATDPRPGRVQLLLRERGLVEGQLQLAGGQALIPFLSKARGSVLVLRAVLPDSERELDQLVTRASEIVWARPLDPEIQIVHLSPLHTDSRSIEVVMKDGEVLRARVVMFKGQRVTELLTSGGQFVPLWRVRSVSEEKRLGDMVLNRESIQSVRELAADEAATEELAPTAAPSLPLHWLVKIARQLELPGAQTITLYPVAPIGEVWGSVCAAAGMDQDELARVVATHLRLPVADLSGIDADVPESNGITLLERYGVRVLSDDGRTLTVATADPMDAHAEQALAFAAQRRIAFAVATPSALGLATEASSPSDAELDDLLAGMGGGATNGIRIEEELEPQEIEIEEVSAEPVIKLANLILREAVRQSASDIHLEPDQSRGIVRFRVDGVLRPYMHIPLAALNRVISRFKVVARLDIADRVRPQDGRVRVRVEGRRYELRLSTVPTQDAEKAVLRIAGTVQEQTLDHLDIPAPELAGIRHMLAHRDGIIVVTGPTGSGKTTTLYGALHELNTGKVNIMTVEDPVERALAGTSQIQVLPKRGVTFASALRAILRQDPDVILVGEIRDLETAEIAVQAAMTGHLVLTTLHTTSAVGVVSRLTDLGLDRSTLSAALRGIVAQRLARRTCGECAGAGCGTCEGSGYRGRLPVMEVLPATPQFTEMISRGVGYQELQRAAVNAGMRPIRLVAEERAFAGETTSDEILRVLGTIEEEEARALETPQLVAAAEEPALRSGGSDLVRLPPGPQANGASGLPALYNHDPEQDTPATRRAYAARALLQGLDRCIAEGQQVNDVMHFACSQLSAAFDSPLVWIGTLDDGALSIRARAGACAPYVRDIVAQWDDLKSGDGAVATALRTGDPQARHLDQEPGFDSWREYARAYGLPIFLALPMEGSNGPLGIVGVHARSVEGLDPQAGQELVSLVDRITGALERLRHLEAVQLQLSALESAADAVFTTDRRGVIQWVNRSFAELTGYSPSEAVGQTASLLRSDRHDAAFYKELWDTILSGQPWRGELYNRRKDGGYVVVEQTITPVTNDRGEVSYFLSVQRDISERKQREEAVQTLVNNDSATGLPNARALDIELGRAVEAASQGRECSLLLIHLSGSATVRDTIGHAEGDALVAAVAEVLKATLRPGDYLARLGDDEFAALLANTPSDGAVIAADRLRAAVGAYNFDIPQLPSAPSISVGIAHVDGSQGPRAILAMADSALYGSREGKDGVIVSQAADAQEAEAEASVGWGERIKGALREDQFFLHFQPVVRLGNRSVSHFDALIRLHDEDGDVIPARAFISHAERLGLMPQLDRWVVENVLRLLHVSPDLRVSLNLSASTVTSAPFRQFLQRQSRNLSAVSGRIIFEVGEIAVVQNLAKVQEHMTRLTELGCRFALDNFGISGGSLASLGALPVDYVKLDGALIRSIDRDESARELVQALTTVARALGKEVIAGWAERESIVALLPELGIGLAQGHHLGRPSRELRAVGNEGVHHVDRVALAAVHGHTPSTNGHRKRLAV